METAKSIGATIYPSCEKPHTRSKTNMEGPTFILVTHFTAKLKLTTVLNEGGEISPLRYECHFTTHNRRWDDL